MVLDDMNYNFIELNLLSRKAVVCCVFVSGFFCSSLVFAADKTLDDLSDDQRLQRLERMLSSDVFRQQTQALHSLREEVSALRGQVEQQAYELNSMKQRQRNLYLDIDRRINNVEAGSVSASGASPVPPPNSEDSPLNPGVNSSVPGMPANGPAGGDVDGSDEYTKAFTLLKEGQYEQSITAFNAFKAAYPNSKYADNAQYWLGEANYVLRDYKKALPIFQQLVSQFPESAKNPGARLKIAYVYFELKNWSAAREALQQVISLYPDTSAAKKAKERLARMKREGH